MYTEIHVDISYFNRNTKQSNATRQNTKKYKVISSLNKCLTEIYVALNWRPSYFVTAAQCCQTSFPLQNQEQRFEDHLELPWLDVHCMVDALFRMNAKSPDLIF